MIWRGRGGRSGWRRRRIWGRRARRGRGRTSRGIVLGRDGDEDGRDAVVETLERDFLDHAAFRQRLAENAHLLAIHQIGSILGARNIVRPDVIGEFDAIFQSDLFVLAAFVGDGYFSRRQAFALLIAATRERPSRPRRRGN